MKACFTCHKSGDIGIDFGPALTEIGDKLAREAMYVSIIDPNEAIGRVAKILNRFSDHSTEPIDKADIQGAFGAPNPNNK